MARTTRLFEQADQPKLIELCRAASVDARIRLSVDRSPDFTLLDRLYGKGWDILIVEQDGDPVAFCDLVHLDLPYGQDVIPATYGRLGGVRPDVQGKGAFREMMPTAVSLIRERGSKMFYGLVNEKNRKIHRALKSKSLPATQGLLNRNLLIHSILLIRRYVRSGQYTYRPAQADDLEDLARLLSVHNQRYLFGPSWEPERLQQTIDRYPDFSIQDIMVAEDRAGHPVACMGFWDQSRARKIRVAGYRPLEYALSRAWNLLGPIARMPSMPKPGGELKMLFSTFIGAEPQHFGALHGLLRHACNEFRYKGYHFLLMAHFSDDSLGAAAEGLWKMTSINRFFILSTRNEIHEILGRESERIPFLDYALS